MVTRGLTNDAARKAAARAAERDIRIGAIADPIRRRDCLADTQLFLRVYFGDVFYQPFTATRRQMIEALDHTARYGGCQAIAGPRGDGKTRSALFVSLKLLVENALRFPLILSKSGPRAARELRNLKHAIQSSEVFRADFPEVVAPILALGGWGSKARSQTAFGEFTNLEWGEECIVFPTIRSDNLGWESAATGQVVASLGIEGPIRGYVVRNDRPDLAILDDIDDRESARSDLQTNTRQAIIEEDVAGLAGPDKTIAMVMLCTLINNECVAAIYTDRQQKPSWRGHRIKLLEEPPENVSLWDEYISLRHGRDDDDPNARRAHEFYLQHRDKMDCGARVSNPFRFDPRPLADGEPGQVSALQACYDIIADRGWDHFNTEYQNEPPEEDKGEDVAITADKIQSRLSGYGRGEIPPECTVLVQGIDVQKRRLHWVIKAFAPNATSYVVDYDVYEIPDHKFLSESGVETLIYNAILGRMEEARTDYPQLNYTLIDSGWLAHVVYRACREIGQGIKPAKGHGKSHGCASPNFHDVFARTKDRKPGDGWFEQRQPNGIWLLHCDTDRWKAFEHARWMTPEGKPGAAYLFGHVTDDERRHLGRRLPQESKQHFSFAKHITSECEGEDIVRGRLIRVWRNKYDKKHPNNHWLDASCLANVAGAMLGVRLISEPKQKTAVKRNKVTYL